MCGGVGSIELGSYRGGVLQQGVRGFGGTRVLTGYRETKGIGVVSKKTFKEGGFASAGGAGYDYWTVLLACCRGVSRGVFLIGLRWTYVWEPLWLSEGSDGGLRGGLKWRSAQMIAPVLSQGGEACVAAEVNWVSIAPERASGSVGRIKGGVRRFSSHVRW